MIPSLAEEYVHRIGRTARAGKEGARSVSCRKSRRIVFMDIERLINQEVKILDLPEKLEISQLLLEENRCRPIILFINGGNRKEGGLPRQEGEKYIYCRG